MESNKFGTECLTQGTNSRPQIDSSSNFMIGTGRMTDTSSSSDSAILSASMSETSDEEFEFPPLPLTLPPPTPVILPDETDAQPPPPFPLDPPPITPSETSKDWDNESGFQNDEDEFPPPPPECFSPTSPIAKVNDGQESNRFITKDTCCPPKLEVETIVPNKESNKLKLPSSFCYLTGGFKPPRFLNGNPSQEGEESMNSKGNFEVNKQVSNDSSIGKNLKPFAKLLKQLNSEATADRAEHNPSATIGNSVNFSETIKESRMLLDSENIISEEASFVDAAPPPLFDEDSKASDSVFQNSFSLSKAELTENSSLGNIIKEYYEDVGKPDETENNETKARSDTPVIANALLPKHWKDGSKSEVTVLRKESFDAAVKELKGFMSDCDKKSALFSPKSSLVACRGTLSTSTSIDSCSNTGYESISMCSAIPQTVERNEMEHQKVKLPTTPKTFRLKKVPKVLGFTEEQIKTTIEVQNSTKFDTNCGYPNSLNEDTSEPCDSSLSNDQIKCNMPQQGSLIHKEVIGNVVEDLKETSLGLTNYTKDNKNITKDKVDGPIVAPIDDFIISKKNDNIGIMALGRIQESKKIFESANKVDDGPTKVKRSKSVASLQRKPTQIRPIEKSIEAESNFSTHSREEDGLRSQHKAENSVSKSNVGANEEKSDEILPVSEAKAFFENIKPSQGIKNPDRILPKKSLTFSVNKTFISPKLLGLRNKYQNQESRDPLNVTKNTVEETTTSNDESIDAASHLPFESLVSKFGTLKKTPIKKDSILENCAPPESGTKLPGKSFSSIDVEPKNFVANQNQNKHAWKSFLQSYSEK